MPTDPPAPAAPTPAPADPPAETCEICGSTRLEWLRCKLICANCRTILKSCADL